MKNKKYLKIKYYLWYNPSKKTLYKPIQEKSGNNGLWLAGAIIILTIKGVADLWVGNAFLL